MLNKRSVLRGGGADELLMAAVCASAVSLSSLYPSLCGKLALDPVSPKISAFSMN